MSDVPPKPQPARKLPFSHSARLSPECLENPFWSPQPLPIHWAVGWADLMMTMFVVFLVMYLYPSAKLTQTLQAAEEYQGGEAEQSGVPEQQGAGAGGKTGQGGGGPGKAGLTGDDQAPAELLKLGIGSTEGRSAPSLLYTAKIIDLTKIFREDEVFAKFAEIELTPERTIRIALASDLLFPSGKADLRLIAKENILKISELLQETSHRINVIGHTDNQPIRGGAFASNWELSVMRATAVARFLIEEMGVPASLVTVSGQSFYQPQANNDTPANRAKNRRVEIIVSLDPGPALPVTDSSLLPKAGDK